MSDEMSAFARQTIASLGLSPHPEGGWYRRTWASGAAIGSDGPVPAGQLGEDGGEDLRPLASLIYFLLPEGEASAWHVVDADEIWLWHGPAPLALELGGEGPAPDAEKMQRFRLGLDAHGGQAQLIVPAGTWQRTLPGAGDVLVSCVVSPGFVYAGFELASQEQ